MENNNQTQGFSVMHSYPFINDGPTDIVESTTSNKLKHRHSLHLPTNHSEQKDKITKQVPPGVIHIKPTWKPVRLDEKPPFSYATLIAHAILSSENRRLTLSEIYQWISKHYPCYSMKDHRWQNSIRHNLSLQKAFVKLERDTNTPSGKGCYWTILPGYEQPFIDNLMKRSMGGSNGTTTSGRKHNENGNDDGNSYTSHKQFRKFIDATISNNNHLFTIFRMNPTTTTTTTTTTTATATENSKKQRTNKKMKKEQEEEEQKQEQPIEQQDPIYDSDCDSGVDLNCEVLPKKEGMSIPPSSIQNQASLNSLFMENSMFVPDDLLLTQQPNTNRTQNCFLDSMIDTTTTSFYDPIEYWDAPPPPPQTSLFDFTQSQQPMMLPQQQGLVDYYCNEPTTFNSYVTTLNQQPPQDFFLYNNFC